MCALWHTSGDSPAGVARAPIWMRVAQVAAGDGVDAGGIVAEKSTVWRSSGSRRIASMSSAKPMSSISSASSSTTTWTESSVPRPMWSSAGPEWHDDVHAATRASSWRPMAGRRRSAGPVPAGPAVLVDRLGPASASSRVMYEDERRVGRPPVRGRGLAAAERTPPTRCPWRPGRRDRDPEQRLPVGSVSALRTPG